ncbi:nucleotidyl transferase AbiEii/AbiGii toxin family protein [Cytophaga sp. FL35]|uniref:nucleotidyl transferase AbiEii/AbiGii toxin family protein n=1 Tax=Cytophaga sp. FL35 TaxID=1904456 RepID=UPI001653D23D|nr:nucleotidyl transferase AbiEii/AbiGii toxin family protein [Cytophaga sp. FL35]MBC7000659.1 nucleotidyltransferase [Cytophaga sp. FL35]
MRQWKEDIDLFLEMTNKHGVRMLMVGGGAVNFHGHQRHSADVDFWIDPNEDNFKRLVKVFNEMGYEIEDFPHKVKKGQQNISIKFSPVDLNLELITNFSVNKSFDQAYEAAEEAWLEERPNLKWKVLNIDDLITSKLKSGRPKDLADVQELKRINNID